LPTKRLTRKEIVQTDRIQATLTEVYEWTTRHAKKLVATLAVVVLTLLTSHLWSHYEQSQEVEFQKAFAEALEIYHAPLDDQKEPESDPGVTSSKYSFQSAAERHQKALNHFDALAQRHPSTRLGLLARYYVALNKRELGQAEEAKKILYWVIEHTEETDIRNLARTSLAELARLENNQEEAIQLLTDLLDAPWPAFPKQMALLQLAKSYEAQGNLEEALKQYKRISAEYPSSGYTEEAQLRITQLESEQ
jgi:predicted negative regulator of RcsB-dependent stress response